MKKLLFAIFAVSVLFSACSKEAKLNKQLDGTWKLISVNGAATSTSGESITMKFEKDKKGKGSYTYSFTDSSNPSNNYTDTGTYELSEDEKITITSSASGSTPTTTGIESYSKTQLTLKIIDSASASFGSLMVYEKQ